ncbi:arfaptin 2 [Echinococcus multilocularis]|uniref:Arfaptin 2 n=1 Tax=Echinococcus multilocularis TaxID=6211 RepID=A0A087W0A0_ECHMU|nr:arfaptin 2 [Echinococcus multilocularis]
MPIVGGASVDSADSDLRNDVQPNNDIMNAPTRSQKGFGNNGSLDLPGKIENFKAWSSTAMRCTKQVIEEKLGTTSPTRDPETQAKIEEIKRIQAKYQGMSASVKKMIGQMNAMTGLEQSLSSQFTIAAQQQPELDSEFMHNSEIQRVVATSTASYVSALELFCDGLDTFCKKTVPDTLTTIRQLEHARLVYDTYRNELERMESKAGRIAMQQGSTGGDVANPVSTDAAGSDTHSTPASASTPQQEINLQQLRQKFATGRENYLALRVDTDVKMKLLHENRVRVLRKHLQALQAATLSYFANGYRDLELTLKTLSERNALTNFSPLNQPAPSFLEVESPSTDQKPAYLPLENGEAEHHQRDVFD